MWVHKPIHANLGGQVFNRLDRLFSASLLLFFAGEIKHKEDYQANKSSIKVIHTREKEILYFELGNIPNCNTPGVFVIMVTMSSEKRLAKSSYNTPIWSVEESQSPIKVLSLKTDKAT